MVSHCDFSLFSLVINDVEHLFVCLLAIVYILSSNIYSNTSTIFFFNWLVFGFKL